MTFHYVELETYCHATEDPERVKEALTNLAGEDAVVEEQVTKGYYGNTITIMRCKLTRKRYIKKFFDDLPCKLKDSLRVTLELRTDDECNLHFRIDRGSAYTGEPELSEGGYVVKLRCRVECYPARKEKALDALNAFFSC